jgi:hypothetical protein
MGADGCLAMAPFLIVQAVRAGLGSIVPAKLLALFTAGEFETMVCGKKQVRGRRSFRCPAPPHGA